MGAAEISLADPDQLTARPALEKHAAPEPLHALDAELERDAAFPARDPAVLLAGLAALPHAPIIGQILTVM